MAELNKRDMNLDEKLVKSFLSLTFNNIVFEPDGNIPPDFLVEDSIAVEVRRLNQNHTSVHGVTKGLEEDSIPLWQKVEKLLLDFGAPINNKSWFIGIHFQRPIESWAKLAPKIKKTLEVIKKQEPVNLSRFPVSENFELDVIPSSKIHKVMFFMAASSDGNSGGFVLSELEKNLKFIIAEKSKKIEKYKSKYKEWWLVLPDHIAYSLDNLDRAQFREYIKIEHSWDKIILINPLNVDSSFEI